MLTVRMNLHNLQTNFLQWQYRRTVERGIAKQLSMRKVTFPMEIKMRRILVTKETKKENKNQTNSPTKTLQAFLLEATIL